MLLSDITEIEMESQRQRVADRSIELGTRTQAETGIYIIDRPSARVNATQEESKADKGRQNIERDRGRAREKERRFYIRARGLSPFNS